MKHVLRAASAIRTGNHGLKQVTLKKMLETKPEDVVSHAVKGMLPKNTLGRSMMKKLHVYAGPDHNHAAQKPEVLEINV